MRLPANCHVKVRCSEECGLEALLKRRSRRNQYQVKVREQVEVGDSHGFLNIYCGVSGTQLQRSLERRGKGEVYWQK
jgi:hypothetical protein